MESFRLGFNSGGISFGTGSHILDNREWIRYLIKKKKTEVTETIFSVENKICCRECLYLGR